MFGVCELMEQDTKKQQGVKKFKKEFKEKYSNKWFDPSSNKHT